MQIFLSLSNCWRQGSFSGRFAGLLRADIESTLDMFNIRLAKRRTMLNQLTAMERVALEILNQK